LALVPGRVDLGGIKGTIMNPTIWTAIQPIASQAARDVLRTVGVFLAAHGYITNGSVGTEAFIGAGMTLAGLFWGWFTTSGYLQLAGLLKKLTATKTQAAAVTAAQVLPPAAAVDTPAKAVSVQSVTKVVGCFLLAMILASVSPVASRAQTAADPLGLSKLMSNPTVQALVKWAPDDIDAAAKLSTAIPTLQDTTGSACWSSFQQMGGVLRAHPLPITLKAATDFEGARLFFKALKNVCTNSNCTQVFADASNQIGAFTPIPTGISLTTLCSKIL
jgi:hypothetical protein